MDLARVAVVAIAGLAAGQAAWASTSKDGSRPVVGVDSKAVHELFVNPPAEYAAAPLWTWNDLLTEDQVRQTMRDMAAQKVMQVFVHPRPGLMTPYLSEDWFRLWKVALDEGEKLGMLVWIYDENSYPSGFAGGFVPDQMPESRGRGLRIRDVEELPKADGDVVAVYQPAGEGFKNITAEVKAGNAPAKGKYLVADVIRAQPKAWHGGKTYVDLMYPGVTEKFLEITLEPYRERMGHEFGKRIPGSFTDEPELVPAGGLPWTPDLPEQFEKQWKYNLLDHLPSLVREVGDFRKVRHDYIYMLNHLFIERWAKPYYEYCETYNLQFTGHYWEHGWPNSLQVPDNMAMGAWQQLPGIDNLMNTYSETLHAQFGNTRTVRELASVANQMGRTRTLCEAYGAGGWDLRFEDMKRIGDWLYVLGVNLLDPHLSYVTIKGARKRDHPQSFSYHTPWWEAYHVSAEYFARLSAALSAGRQINDVLLIQPTTTCWMYEGGGTGEHLKKIGESFEAMIRDWEHNQIEYDLGSEDIMARNGSVDAAAGTLVVGKAAYKVVVLAPMTENLGSRTVELLAKFIEAGGTVIACDEPPARVDGRVSERVRELSKHRNWMSFPGQQAMAVVRGRQWASGLQIIPTMGAEGQPYHQRRVLDDGDLVFLVNTRIDKPAKGVIRTTQHFGFENWDLQTGRIEQLTFSRSGRKLEFTYQLPPCGSMLVFMPAEPRPGDRPLRKGIERAKPVPTVSPLQIKRMDPNVLVLDYVDVTCKGETRKSIPATQAGHWLYAQHGMGRNVWDRAVQFKDELITKTFPADSGFEASYRFVIDEALPSTISAVIEQADLYEVTCNGKPLKARKGDWWLDKSFGRIDIASAVKLGENVLTIKAAPFSIFHELEAAYIIGDFSLRAADSGFTIVPEQALQPGPWNEQGCRLYGHRVSYKQTFQLENKPPACQVRLPAWHGSVAKVLVNGRPAGHIAWQPWTCDVSEQIVAGANEIEVIVYGTLRNTLGPSHNPALGTAWPGMWDKQPEPGPPAGASYTSVGYGLFEPFVLEVTAD